MLKPLALGVMFGIPILLAQQATQDLRPEGSGVNPSASQPATDPSAEPSAAPTFTPLTAGEKVERRAERLFEPLTLVGAAMGAGIDQWRNVPPQWGQGAEGYGTRFGSAMGYDFAHNGVALGFDLAMHTDPRYHRLPEAGFKARLWNAVSQSFIANKDDGGRTINMAEIGGNFGAGFIANAWNPPGYNTVGDGLERGALGFAFHTGKNVLREFMPDLLRAAHLRSSN